MRKLAAVLVVATVRQVPEAVAVAAVAAVAVLVVRAVRSHLEAEAMEVAVVGEPARVPARVPKLETAVAGVVAVALQVSFPPFRSAPCRSVAHRGHVRCSPQPTPTLKDCDADAF